MQIYRETVADGRVIYRLPQGSSTGAHMHAAQQMRRVRSEDSGRLPCACANASCHALQPALIQLQPALIRCHVGYSGCWCRHRPECDPGLHANIITKSR